MLLLQWLSFYVQDIQHIKMQELKWGLMVVGSVSYTKYFGAPST